MFTAHPFPNLAPNALRAQSWAVLGAGESGMAMATWLSRHGAIVHVLDSRPLPPHQTELKSLGINLIPSAWSADDASESAQTVIHRAQAVAVSPGIPLAHPVLQLWQKTHPFVGEVDLFDAGIKAYTPQAQCIGITGSNGKTTTTALLGALLHEEGLMVATAGNIKPTLLSRLMQAVDAHESIRYWVLELSSFQLASMRCARFNVGAILNISPNHLDWHPTMDDYVAAKKKLIAHSDQVVINVDDGYREEFLSHLKSKNPKARRAALAMTTPFAPLIQQGYTLVAHPMGESLAINGEVQVQRDHSPLIGEHNSANILAALAMAALIKSPLVRAKEAIHNFKPLPHRTEKIAEHEGVWWVNDSKSTTVAATRAAILGINRPLILIAGGVGKGQDFSPLADIVHKRCREVLLFGQSADQLAHAIGPSYIRRVADLNEAVTLAKTLARSGDCVLLSPACASFDQFPHYGARGESFRTLVHQHLGLS